MMRSTLLVSLLLLTPVACGPHGNGRKTTVVREASGFSRVDNGTALDVVVHRGMDEHVQVILDENLQDYVQIYVSGGTLHIDTDSWLSWNGDGRVEVSLPVLEGVIVSGSGDFFADGDQEPVDFVVEVTASGDVEVCGGMRTLEARVSASGDLVVCQGEGAALEYVKIDSSASGDLLWEGAAETIEASISGTGDVTLRGTALALTATTSGSGMLNARELPTQDAVLTSRASGDMRATVNGGRAEVRISGSGDVEIWGDGTVDLRANTGSGNLIRH